MLVYNAPQTDSDLQEKVATPCVMVILGASGDLTKRLLMPALYNLACDGLLSENFAIVGMARRPLTDEQFREGQRTEIQKFSTRKTFEPKPWDWLESRLHYISGDMGDPSAFERLRSLVKEVND